MNKPYYIVSTAHAFGDYLPDSSMEMTEMQTFRNVRDHIAIKLRIFVIKSSLATLVENGVGTLIYIQSIKILIDFMETCQKTDKMVLKFSDEEDDDRNITFTVKGQTLKVCFNGAPNNNEWDQLDIAFKKIE